MEGEKYIPWQAWKTSRNGEASLNLRDEGGGRVDCRVKAVEPWLEVCVGRAQSKRRKLNHLGDRLECLELHLIEAMAEGLHINNLPYLSHGAALKKICLDDS